MGGLAACRFINRRKFGVLMFHRFQEPQLQNLEALCAHLVRYFEPMPLSAIAASIQNQRALPNNAIAVTVDDGYRDFLTHGHPVFHRYKIPTSIFVVSGFADGRLWLWHDQIEHALMNSSRKSMSLAVDHHSLELDLATEQSRAAALDAVREDLKQIPNHERLAFLAELRKMKGIEIPAEPPAKCTPLNWRELRALAAQDVEIGCHTDSHPILSRLATRQDLDKEVHGAGKLIEEKIGKPVRHFCYPNGRPVDISAEAIRCVREAGYLSAVTCESGLNSPYVERLQIRRIAVGCDTDRRYETESFAGLHL